MTTRSPVLNRMLATKTSTGFRTSAPRFPPVASRLARAETSLEVALFGLSTNTLSGLRGDLGRAAVLAVKQRNLFAASALHRAVGRIERELLRRG
jgi:hypothetical protein